MVASSLPKLSHHKASDQGVVRLDGKDFYLGRWSDEQTQHNYERLMAEWLAGGRKLPTEKGDATTITVTEVIASFWDWANTYYRFPDGTLSKEISSFREALKPLRRLYGHTAAAAFGPLALKSIRQSMIDAGLCRTNINRRIGRIKRVFKWGTENELIPPSVFHALQAVSGLKAGRCGVRESEPVKPAPEHLIEAILPFLSRQVAAMVRLQLLTGMRPGEVVAMRGIDIDISGDLWFYRPSRHKAQYLGQERTVLLGPKGKKILKDFLKPDLNAFLFSPADADVERRAMLHQLRKTPLSCGNGPGTNVKRNPRKKPQDHYSVGSYSRAIKYAAERAFPSPEHLGRKRLDSGKFETHCAWRARLSAVEKSEIKAWRKAHHFHPHQLRHSAATNLRKNYGLEPAQLILGHKTLTVTQVYAEKNVEAAMRLMAEVG